MKIFITGASGYIGYAVARALRRRGHDVSGLVRQEERGKKLWAHEIRPVVGDLRKPESYATAAKDAEVIVHAAAELGKDMAELDRQTVERLVAAGKDGQRQRTLIYTSGCWVYGNTGAERVNERTPVKPLPIVAWRPGVEELVLRGATERLFTNVIRPGCVYGGRAGLTAMWFDSAEKEGAARIVGEGHNRWATVHVEDLAEVYALAVDRQVRGEIFNVADRSRATVREMGAAASRAAQKGGEVRTWSMAEASKALSPYFAEALTVDQHMDAWKAVQLLGWNPRFGGFADEADIYYRAYKNTRD